MPSKQAEPLTVLFDLDGTLIDSIELIVSAARHAFASRNGPAPSEDEFKAGIGQPLTTQFAPYVRTPAELDALIAAYRGFQIANHDRLTTLYDGIDAAVGELRQRGHRLGIVTSKADAIARRSLRHVGLEDAIEVLVGCDATSRHKPHPEPVLHAMERLRSTPQRSVFIGDSPYDVQAGNAAGVATVAVTWGAFRRDTLAAAGPSYVLERPHDIPLLIDAIAQRGQA
ncbi:MAG: Pyrophosphatase PpaX [Gemmatimonadaceae bacterium]|nr:Pyrophosphatase PpaX [Gemmatimonadaceae bacterium]